MYICASVASTKAVPAPKKAINHIHTIAPGPPKPMAVATPTMLPVPTLPERAMAKAWNDEMPTFFAAFTPLAGRCAGASASCCRRFFSAPISSLNISPKRRTCTKRVRNEK